MTHRIRSAALAALLSLGSAVTLAQGAPAGGPPPGGMPGGGPPMMPSRPPSRAAIYIEDGAETGGTSKLIVNDSSVTPAAGQTYTGRIAVTPL